VSGDGLGHSFKLALGLERIGLVSLRWPQLVSIVIVLLCVGASFGVMRLQTDDSLSQLFRSDTPEFKQYEAVTRKFPSSEYDVLVVATGRRLLQRETIEKLRDLVIDLQLIEGSRGIISLFSAREPPRGDGVPPPLFPKDLPEGADYDRLIEQVRANEIIRGKLLSEDGELALIVLAIDPDVVEGKGLGRVVNDIREAAANDMEGTGVDVQLSGVPVMQLNIRTATESEHVFYNAIGFIAGCIIAILFFRRLSFMVMAAGPPIIAILLSLGMLGWLDFRLNMFLNVMTPLIMVISFSDTMQLTFAARDRLLKGESKYDAIRNALLVVGPACVLTHGTAGLSFAALLMSDSGLIRDFGRAGLLATGIAFVAVLTLMPLFGVLLIRRSERLVKRVAGRDVAVNALRKACGGIARHMVRHPFGYSLASLAVVAVLAGIYANLDPRYRLADQVPNQGNAVTASNTLDAKLTGAQPIDILVEFPKGASLYDERTLKMIADVHRIVEEQAGVGNVWSLETLRRWLRDKLGTEDAATLSDYVHALPDHLTRRFISQDGDSVVISGRVPDIDASQLLPVVDKLDAALGAVRAANPGYSVSVTGLLPIAARNSAAMIGKLNHALTIEIFFVAAFIGLAFRSLFVMLISILPGIFPIVLSGAVLWAMGEGLQFASVVALTVSFGLGLSATIHYINRLWLEYRPGEDPALGVIRPTVLVGPALILTSLVLACGLGVTIFSQVPSLRTFGWLSAFAMLAALVGDLLILPSTVMAARMLFRRLRPAHHPAE
jgi:predicted RND superfamily exporter protein